MIPSKIVDKLGTAMIPRTDPEAVERCGTDRRALAPQTSLGSVSKTGQLFTVENLSLYARRAETAFEIFWNLVGPIVGITQPATRDT
jgi:hypothetical protein